MCARSRKVGLGRIGRWLVPAVGAAMVVSMAAGARPAAGADNPAQGLPIRQTNYFYAYVGDGETLSATFAKIRNTAEAPDAPIAVRVEGPAGAGAKQCDIDAAAPVNTSCTYSDLTSTEAGIWRISFIAGPQRTTLDWYTWDITVFQGAVAIPGRVWADYYLAVQPSVLTGSPIDVSLWYQQRFGYTYRGDFQNLQGIDSLFNANASGNRLADTCLPIYRSVDIPVPLTLKGGSGGCGSYKIFFAPPSPTLPATAKRPSFPSTPLRISVTFSCSAVTKLGRMTRSF